MSHLNDKEVVIHVNHSHSELLSYLLCRCEHLSLGLDIHLEVNVGERELFDLCHFLHKNLATLHIVSPDLATNSLHCHSAIPFLPNLTRVSFMNQTLNQNLLVALSRAISEGCLPTLTYLGFVSCKGLRGNLSLLFHSKWIQLNHLTICETDLHDADIQILFMTGSSCLLPNFNSLIQRNKHHSCRNNLWLSQPCPNLTSLFLNDSKDHILAKAIKQGDFPNLSNLGLYSSRGNMPLHLHMLGLNCLNALQILILHGYLISLTSRR